MPRTKTIMAYCFRNGEIKFGLHVPKGAISFVKGPADRVRELVLARCRYSYPSQPRAGDEVPLVPGIPEAKNEEKALDALTQFANWIKKDL